MARILWGALVRPSAQPCAPTKVATSGHRASSTLPSRPFWCSLAARIVKPKSEEGKSEFTLKATAKELKGLRAKNTRDEEAMELSDLRKDPRYPEAFIGGVFGILGVKHDEMPEEMKGWKYRIVFRGQDVRSKTGTGLVGLLEEVSNSPARFTASQCAPAAAAVTGKEATLRDVEQAFLQGLIDTPGWVPTWTELPREWWPDEWFVHGDRTRPRFHRPARKFRRTLYGHPEAGAIWEKVLK
ncbi:unnamed protein product [Prorocentrum cordatum]|uniref:Pyridoxal 5'-phosphate synthase n=1 Tax=Prorocentrum cordatum TaxID=2364126 RepID=A0ABN9QZD9_9DINO|nr:unnamed protein product [Polarella glacialis]